MFEKRTSLESLFHISKTHFQENANFCNLVRRKMRNNSDSFSMWAGKKEVNNIFHFHRFLSASLTQKIFSEHLRENPKNRFYSENSLWSRFSYSTRGQLKKVVVYLSFQKLSMTFTLTSPIPGTKIPIFGVLSLLGGFLLQFTMGSFYSFGNMMTYMTSYMRAHGSPNVTYEDFVVVQSTWGMTQGCVMPVSGFLIALIGEKAAMTSGAFIFRYTHKEFF